MMRFLKNTISLLLLALISIFILVKLVNPSANGVELKMESFIPFEHFFAKDKSSINSVEEMDQFGNLIQTMHFSEDEVIDIYGEPERKDLSAYGYEWWVYKEEDQYIQIGINDEMVETIFATGDHVQTAPFSIGTSYDEINEEYPFINEISYESGWKKYVFLISDEELQVKPLIQLTGDLFAVCYFDQFTNELSSVRLVTIDTLLKQRLYDMEYRGSLPEQIEHSTADWKKIEAGIEKQILDITNIYRQRHGLSILKHDDEVANVAYGHSQDMAERNYFSHDTPEGKTVGDRLRANHIDYRVSAENIAYNLSDGPDVSEGWLNSEAHREAVLEPSFTILGVGVYEKYYTQNFLFK